MLNCFKRRCKGRIRAFLRCGIEETKPAMSLIAVSAILVLAFISQSGCAKKSKAVVTASSPVRLVLLPFNVSSEKAELRWTAMAAPILMAKASALSQDIEIVPLWQSMPAAVEAAGASRYFTAESAATVASYMTAKWSTLGEFSPAKKGISMMIDFIPAKASLVPFRYMRSSKLDSVGSGFPEALNEFLGYLVAKPIENTRKAQQSFTSVQALAEALDREYGWFVDAQPGKAQEVVSNLARSDERLARFLFNPSLYPVIAEAK
jgi:hypothetical protein